MLDYIAELKVRLVLFKLLAELLDLSEASVEVSLGLFPFLFDFFLLVKFLLHCFYLPFQILVLLIPLKFFFTEEL